MKQSSGILLYRVVDGQIEVLIVHPSGNYNARAPWSIPKGLPDEGEALEQAARRETFEETGIRAGDLHPLGDVILKKSRKQIHCFAGPAPDDAVPQCTSWEIDRAAFASLDDARKLLHPDQVPLLDRLQELLTRK